MKSVTAISTASFCLGLTMLSCSTAANGPEGQAGSSTGGESTLGGASPGGSSAGGAGGSSAGGSSVGGSSVGGSSGADATTAGTGNTTSAGSAGTNVGGGTGGVPSTGGAGGITGVAGTGGGGGSSGGSVGGSGGSSGGAANLLSLVGGWDGALLQYGCGSNGSPNYDCPEPAAANCKNATQAAGASIIPPSNGAATSWKMGGTAGTTYNVTMHVQGLVEVSWYHNGTRAAGATTSITVTPRNTFQTGGTALTFADTGNGFDYNQYELDVTPGVTAATDVYFLNSVEPSENPHTSGTTQHLTFDVDYTASVKVPANSTVSMTVRDSNCVEVQNCGNANQSGQCGMPRSVSLAGDVPAPPASWNGKVTSSGVGGSVLNGQFVHFDITNVTVAQ